MQDHLRLQVRVTGIANSKRMFLNDEGIDLSRWKELLQNGAEMDMEELINAIEKKNLRNSVLLTLPPTMMLLKLTAVFCKKVFQWLPAIK